MSKIMRIIGDVRGATAIEYGLIAAMIVLAIMGAMSFVADGTIVMWNNVATTLDEAI